MAGSEALRFTVLEGVAAPLGLDNVDTDMIIPKQYLKTVKRTGLGKHAFDEMRYDAESRERPDFILNREPYRHAKILLAGANFGCGSSREHAPWALKDFGVTCVIAESYADIFFNNCFQNGMLPVALPRSALAVLNEAASGPSPVLRVDLERQTVSVPGRGDLPPFSFDIDAGRKTTLLEGLDAIGLTLRHEAAVTAFEEQDRKLRPWLYRRRIDA